MINPYSLVDERIRVVNTLMIYSLHWLQAIVLCFLQMLL